MTKRKTSKTTSHGIPEFIRTMVEGVKDPDDGYLRRLHEQLVVCLDRDGVARDIAKGDVIDGIVMTEEKVLDYFRELAASEERTLERVLGQDVMHSPHAPAAIAFLREQLRKGREARTVLALRDPTGDHKPRSSWEYVEAAAALAIKTAAKRKNTTPTDADICHAVRPEELSDSLGLQRSATYVLYQRHELKTWKFIVRQHITLLLKTK
jgi:hypothetical protein